jgi:hypothetical protein
MSFFYSKLELLLFFDELPEELTADIFSYD